MGVFHYKATFIKQYKDTVYYQFYPDFINFNNIFGEFQIKLEDWRVFIIQETSIDGKETFYCNDRPISALVYKIRKHFEGKGELPKNVFFVA